MKKKIAFHTLGCKLNFSETSTISRMFPTAEYEIVDFKEKADIYVVNSCSVTGTAEKKCRSAVRSAKKRNPDSLVSMIGCFSQLKPEIVSAYPEVDLMLGNAEKYNILHYVSNPDGERSLDLKMENILKTKSFAPSYSSGDRTRSFLKVQDGCDYFCTYCSIPFARGRSRSDTIANTIKVAEEIGKSEMREIILTGVNIGDFGKVHGEKFIDFLKQLEKVEGIDRIRISSIEPELLTDEIIELVCNSNVFLPHFHIPLQSGSDKVLKDMKRNYNTSLYAARVNKIKSLRPDACIAADLIVGFPTETKEDFEDTMMFIRKLDISYVHVFSYSKREDTFAMRLDNVVTSKDIRERSIAMHELSEAKKNVFYSENIGTKRKVLFESDVHDGMMSGWTENYIKVVTKYRPELVNQIVEVTLENQNEDGSFILEI
jgi:threonylcarbamoyladenosine tRNA methylthiotransferase MtaB